MASTKLEPFISTATIQSTHFNPKLKGKRPWPSEKSKKNETMTVEVLVDLVMYLSKTEQNAFFACPVIGEEHDWS